MTSRQANPRLDAKPVGRFAPHDPEDLDPTDVLLEAKRDLDPTDRGQKALAQL